MSHFAGFLRQVPVTSCPSPSWASRRLPLATDSVHAQIARIRSSPKLRSSMMRRYGLMAGSVRVLRVAFLLVCLAAGWADPVAAQGVRADFDGDGRGDLAVGVPGEKGSSGGVNVIY